MTSIKKKVKSLELNLFQFSIEKNVFGKLKKKRRIQKKKEKIQVWNLISEN